MAKDPPFIAAGDQKFRTATARRMLAKGADIDTIGPGGMTALARLAVEGLDKRVGALGE